MSSVANPAAKRPQKRRAFWIKQLHRWHWISSAICLIGMILFALTGITLNHAADIPAEPRIASRTATLRPELLAALPTELAEGKSIPAPLATWIKAELDLDVAGVHPQWSADEIYFSLPRPGGDAWLAIDRQSGEAQYERTDRGLVSYLNDLHKGRNTGKAWFWFIDIFAVACLVFCVTGLCLLQVHASNRPSTWPMVGLGFLAPLFLVIYSIH